MFECNYTLGWAHMFLFRKLQRLLHFYRTEVTNVKDEGDI